MQSLTGGVVIAQLVIQRTSNFNRGLDLGDLIAGYGHVSNISVCNSVLV